MTIASTGWEWADGVTHPKQEDSGSPWDEVRQAVERLPRPWWREARNAGDAAAAAVDVNPFGNDVDIARRVRHRYAAYAAVVARFWAQAAVEASRPGGVLHEG